MKAGLGTKDLIPPCILGVSGTSGWLRAAASPTALPCDGDSGCVALGHCTPHPPRWVQTHLHPLGHWSFIPSHSWDVLRDGFRGAALGEWVRMGWWLPAIRGAGVGEEGACLQTANKSGDRCESWKQTGTRQQLQGQPDSVLRIRPACSTERTSCEMSLGCGEDLVIR